MDPPTRFRRGTNISHWISQTDLADLENRRSRFTPEDARRIGSCGMDHVRLPFDYALLDGAAPGHVSEDGFGWVERALDWCAAEGLGVVLDMHRAPGASFSEAVNPLYDDPRCQGRFAGLWRAIADRFRTRGDELALELLNEATASDPEQWNRVAAIGLEAIRSADPSRLVVIGSNRWNSCEQFRHLRRFDDPRVLYTFHFYDPFCFTHQRAPWCKPMCDLYTEPVPYPGRPRNLSGLPNRVPAEHREWARAFVAESDHRMDRNWLEGRLRPVLEFREVYGVPLYCGEFGALATGADAARRAWYGDVLGLLDKHRIGWANWDYNGGGFGLLDAERRATVVHSVLVKQR